MIVVFCFCTKDQDLALKNAKWIGELGGCKGHELLVCYDPRCNPDTVEAIRVELGKSFDKLWRINEVAQVDNWPQGANYFFRLCCTWLQDKTQWPCFFWLEPDAIPLKPGWLDAIADEYKRGGKPFMGDRVEVQVDGKDVPLHMSGVGVYENPIYLKAGEAYRAYEIAWDMAAREQIIPHAHFTELIEHAWKHPTFNDLSELGTQIAPQSVLFHSSKDGSLIDLLAQKRGGKHLIAGAESPASSSAMPTVQKEPDKPGSPSPLIYDIFIRTYPGDYDWLYYCLKSIRKYVTGFRKTWIVSPASAPSWLKDVDPRAEWKVQNDETENGYLAQQITKLYADVNTDYQPDYILHVDSDVIFTRPTTPGDFFNEEGYLIWYYTAYNEIQTPWQPVTEKFMGCKVGSEYMRRLPMMVPRWLYPRLREFCHRQHGMVITDYIRMQPNKEFSEFNVLGAYASLKYDQKFAWSNTTLDPMPEPVAKQFHSWSGLTPEVTSEIETILGGTGDRMTKDAPSVSSQIKILPSGVWVLENDQISGWVEETGRLDHDPNVLVRILDYINEGDTVVDVGAFIGDHTIAYARKAGQVHAFEPNPVAFECLSHNLLENVPNEDNHHVTLYSVALGDRVDQVTISMREDGEVSGGFVGKGRKSFGTMMRRLDDYPEIKPDLIKIDVEGYELKVLQGAVATIDKYRPKIVLEIQVDGLARQGITPDDIFGWLTQHLYGWRIIEDNMLRSDPLYNIIALPAVDRPGSAQVKAETPVPERIDVSASASTPSPQVPLTYGEMIAAILKLKQFASADTKHRMRVMQNLRHNGLTPKWPRRKTK